MIELTRERLSMSRCLDAVRHPECGGIATFTGTIRNHADSKAVEFLEYEAYEDMARSKMRQVVDEACARWPVRSVAIQHRLGRLDIGEEAVIIAVSAPHRSEALAACAYAIDRLKEIVPIWKKEHGPEGAVWVGQLER